MLCCSREGNSKNINEGNHWKEKSYFLITFVLIYGKRHGHACFFYSEIKP